VTHAANQIIRRPLRQWATLFEITNRSDLSVAYRRLVVRGLPDSESYDKLVNQLVKAVQFEIRQPVALVRRGNAHELVIPADAPLPVLERKLMPHLATLVPEDAVHQLDFRRLDGEDQRIAVAFLHFALEGPLFRDERLWGRGRAQFGKRALNADDPGATVDVYPGFRWNVVADGGGRLFLAVDATVKYIDRRWLTERVNGGDPRLYRARHCLYHFGHQWYMVQLWGVTGLSIAEQRFQPAGANEPIDVLAYTREKWGRRPAPWVRDLDPNSPAIVYRYPGNDREQYGALGLCKLAIPTGDPAASSLHRRSILDPTARMARVRDVVERHFQGPRLDTKPVRISREPLEVAHRVFSVPAQRLGHERVLAVDGGHHPEATDVVALPQLGAQRLKLLLDPEAGPLDTSPFDAQYVVLPRSVPRAINQDFEQRFERAMREVSGQSDYRARRIVYDDRGATSLVRQVEAIRAALGENGVTRGYALLILPPRAKPDLHNYVKRDLWPNLQFQCAMATKIQGYYQACAEDPGVRPLPGTLRQLANYVRNCALGMMVVNRKWGWALAAPLRHDVHIGIDVLNGVAGVTYVFDRGRTIMFHDYVCKQRERLTAPQLRTVLVADLRRYLGELGVQPRSIVVHRDGRTYASELKGMRQALVELKAQLVVARDATLGVVEIRKTSAELVRLFEGNHPGSLENPTVGSHLVLGPRDGVVCTTGQPFRFPGTAKPLAVHIAEGDLDIVETLEDVFALSQLVFTAPDKCARLPVTIKLSDDLLEPIASTVDDEAARYEDEEDWDDTEAAEGKVVDQPLRDLLAARSAS